MMWMVCARRLLRIEELQEAVAFGPGDKSWNADKIPDGDKMIKSCHGLVVRDTEDGTVCLAHHTVQQYLVSPQERQPATSYEGFEEFTARVHFWPELYKFRCDNTAAEVLAGKLCVTYLCFSDFGTAVSRRQDDKKLNLTTAFRDRGPLSIPAVLGLGKHLHSLPYRFFGAQNTFKMPDIDYSKYLNIKARDRPPPPSFRKKYALLEYVIEYWSCHTLGLNWSSEPGLAMQFWDLVQHKSLAFEFRPWGSNQHFGPLGCKSCPVPDHDDLEPKDLPSMSLVHWAAETGHLKVFDIVEPPLPEYLRHERHHDETLLIACRHGQVAVIETLLARGTFNLSDGRAIIAACTAGSVPLLERLFQAQEATLDIITRPASSSVFDFRRVGSIALYQAAGNGHESIVDNLLSRGVSLYVRDKVTGLTPLHIAARNGHLEAVRALCSAFRSLDITDAPHEVTGMIALHYAALSGRDDIITLLLNHGWACDNRDLLGETALIKASKEGQAIVAETLLKAGADPFVKGGENYDMGLQTPLSPTTDLNRNMAPKPVAAHHAAANGHDNVLAILPYSDWTCGDHAVDALHIGAAYGHHKVVQTLLSKGARIKVKDNEGLTALHYASSKGHTLVVQLLLNRGSITDWCSDAGLTPLHLAGCAGKIETIKVLVAHGATIDAKTTDKEDGRAIGPTGGSTPLHLAAYYADADTVRALVECGASLEERDDDGWTALELSIHSNRSANMLALIELGAEWSHYAVFVFAIRVDDPKIVELLVSKLLSATGKEQQDAAAKSRAALEASKSHRKKEGWQMLDAWERVLVSVSRMK